MAEPPSPPLPRPPALRTVTSRRLVARFGVLGGPILAGVILDTYSDLSGQLWIITIDPYTPVFTMAIVAIIASRIMLSRVRNEIAA